jgi:hypothetical protein
VLHYKEKTGEKLIVFIIGLHSKRQGCGASVVFVAGPFTIEKPTFAYEVPNLLEMSTGIICIHVNVVVKYLTIISAVLDQINLI